MTSSRQEIFPPSIEHLQFFSSTDCAEIIFLIPKISHNRGSLSDNFFSDAPLEQSIYFSNFSHADNFFPITTPPEGKNNGPSQNR